ncbi:MAG: hypothetical protein ACHBN1_00005 [Heteroscytonema crispum UTEX LB 1556]
MSVVLGVVGNSIGEVVKATIPFRRLDLFAHPGMVHPISISDAINAVVVP